MAGIQQIVNPDSSLKEVSDYRTGKTTSGERLGIGYTVREYRATGAIALGDVVALHAPTSATDPGGVRTKVTAAFLSSVVGVAEKAATAAGQIIPVCVEGLTFVNVGAATPAAGNTATVQANSGAAAVGVAEADATTVVGSILGSFWGAKDAANRAPVIVNRQ